MNYQTLIGVVMISQFRVSCAVYRGGTSRGIFFNKEDLPEDRKLQYKIFMSGIDAYNPSQINGLGSGTSHSSKVCVISKSNHNEIDVDYTFYQIGIGEELVDDKGTCGNLMAAVGAYAVDEGLVDVEPHANQIDVKVFNTNIKRVLTINVPVINGKAKVAGDYMVPGLSQPGAKFVISILDPGGGKTGRTLPLGSVYALKTEEKSYDVTFADAVNPFVFVQAKDLGITGVEPNRELASNKALLDEIETIRSKMAVVSGMAATIAIAKQAPSVPKIAIVTEPQDYVTQEGELIKADDVDLVAKMLSMGAFHRTFAGSGLYCIAAAAMLPGTIVNRFTSEPDNNHERIIRIGHPEGVANVKVARYKDKLDIAYVGLERTARRIIKGDLYIPE